MDANELTYVDCRNGVFLLPDAVFATFSAHVPRGVVYLRDDADTFTISATPLAQGRRRVLTNRFRTPLFRNATRLAVVNLKEALQVMPVEWR